MTHLSQGFEKFWDLIEVKLGCNVPIYVQNILALNGYENALSIKTLTSEDMEYLRNYARNDMHNRIPEGANLSDYYGPFSERPKEFEFLRGHLKLMEQLVLLINETILSKGHEYFSFKKQKVVQTKITVQKEVQGNISNRKSLYEAITDYLCSSLERSPVCTFTCCKSVQCINSIDRIKYSKRKFRHRSRSNTAKYVG